MRGGVGGLIDGQYIWVQNCEIRGCERSWELLNGSVFRYGVEQVGCSETFG